MTQNLIVIGLVIEHVDLRSSDPSDMTICAAPGVPYILPEVRQSDLTPSVGIVMTTNHFVPWACASVLLTACDCPINVKDAQAISGSSAGLTL